MNAPRINGYLVVSLKEPGTTYQGPDRSPWDRIDEGFYEGTMSDRMRSAYGALGSDGSRGFWWPTCTDLKTAKMFAEHSRVGGKSAEVIAIYSPYLAQSQGRKGWHEPRARFLGVDIVAVGEWSLVRALLEARDPECRNAVRSVNAVGLLPDASCARIIEARYRTLAEANLVEPIADADSRIPVEAVAVYGLEDDHDDE
jgi:hypothetical protein